MSSLITVRLYNDDGTPKTGDTPKLSAIRQSDKVEVLNSVDMEEVGNGFYQYDYVDYKKDQLYFFSIDNEQYDSVNTLDSYGNKNTRGRDNSVIINTENLAKEIWNAKATENNKDGTMGAVVQRPLSYSEIIVAISDIQSQAQTLAQKLEDNINSNTILAVKGEIGKIKIPNATEIDYEKIEECVEEAIEEYVKPKVKEAMDEYENKEEYKEKYDDTEIRDITKETINILNDLSNSIVGINDKVENMSKQDLVDGVIKVDIRGLVNKIKEENLEKIDSVGIKVGEDINILKKGIMNLSAKLDK